MFHPRPFMPSPPRTTQFKRPAPMLSVQAFLEHEKKSLHGDGESDHPRYLVSESIKQRGWVWEVESRRP